MALGRTHDFVNLIALPVCLYYVPKEFYIPFTIGYLFGTFFLSPDLDLPSSKPSKRWKKLKFIWRPYQLLSKHRGLSHVPLIGSFLRFSYLIILFIFFYFVLLGISSKYLPEVENILLNFDPFEMFSNLAQREEVFYFALGVIASEIFHVFIDLFVSFIRKKIR